MTNISVTEDPGCGVPGIAQLEVCAHQNCAKAAKYMAMDRWNPMKEDFLTSWRNFSFKDYFMQFSYQIWHEHICLSKTQSFE
jgi:hypothetical protein